MTYRGKFFIAILSASITFYAFFGVMMGWFDARAQQPINDPGAQIRIFESVLQHIQNDYVDEPNLEKVRTGALRGLAYGLDPYSSYLTAEQVETFKPGSNPNPKGIGAEFSQFSSYLYVVSVIEGSPAGKAGLEAGDVVEYIESKATRDISLYDALQMIGGPSGSTVKLRVIRTGEKPQTISIVRGDYKIPPASGEIKTGGIGVVKVHSLQRGQAETARSQIKGLAGRGVKKIVLDLRNVAGGEIEEGISLANAFFRDGDLAKVIGRENKVVKTYSADPAKFLFDGDLAVLIDFGSAGASEVVASAVLERKRGEVVGERTFGAGAAQELFKLRGGDGLLLTTTKWASVSGKPFMAAKRTDSGLKPSVEVKQPDTPEPLDVEELIDPQDEEEEPSQVEPEEPAPVKKPKRGSPDEDLQLKKAIEILQGKSKAAKV